MNRSKRLLQIKPEQPVDRLDPWEIRHNNAVTCPTPNEAILISMIQSVALYVRHAEMSEGLDVGQWRDYALGDGVGTMIEGIRTLLNGDISRLDGGTLDAVLTSLAERVGYDLDLSKWVGSDGV